MPESLNLGEENSNLDSQEERDQRAQEVISNQEKILEHSKDKAPEIKEFELNGSTVRIVGVYHTTKNLEAHNDILEEEIANSEVLVLEGFPSQQDYNLNEIINDLGKNVNFDRKKVEELYLGSGIEFYDAMAKKAHRHKKDIYTVDPLRHFNLAMAKAREKVDDKLLKREVFMAAGGGGFLAISGLIHAMSQFRRRGGQPESLRMTRRDFLRFGVRGAAVVSILPLLGRVFEEINMYTHKDPSRVDNFFQTFSASFMDFRNVMIAEGLDRLTKENPGKKITMIYGEAHIHPVERYSTEWTIRKAKEAAYIDINNELDPAIVHYVPTDKGWEKQVEAKL